LYWQHPPSVPLFKSIVRTSSESIAATMAGISTALSSRNSFGKEINDEKKIRLSGPGASRRGI